MVHDITRAVPQPVVDPAAHDIAVPVPRAPLDPTAHEIAGAAPPRGPDPAAQHIARPAHPSRAGWLLSTVVAAAAAWALGWVAGVSWAWREMTPRYLSRTHRRRGAGLPGVGQPVR